MSAESVPALPCPRSPQSHRGVFRTGYYDLPRGRKHHARHFFLVSRKHLFGIVRTPYRQRGGRGGVGVPQVFVPLWAYFWLQPAINKRSHRSAYVPVVAHATHRAVCHRRFYCASRLQQAAGRVLCPSLACLLPKALDNYYYAHQTRCSTLPACTCPT